MRSASVQSPAARPMTKSGGRTTTIVATSFATLSGALTCLELDCEQSCSGAEALPRGW